MTTKNTKVNRLTGTQFLAGCKALESMREFVLAERPTKENVARMVGEIVGCKISVGNMESIYEATGIRWTAAKSTTPPEKSKTSIKRVSGTKHRQHTLKIALVLKDLLISLGESVPTPLNEVITYLSNRLKMKNIHPETK